MQPHSMAVLALAGFIWNRPRRYSINKAVMRVEYLKNGKYASNIYELTDIEESEDQRELVVRTMRGGGGLSCTMDVRRSSAQEGAEVTMTHRTIHVSGLREVFKLYKTKIVAGMHYNSRRYRNFKGEYMTPDRKKLRMYCEVKRSDGYFTEIPYDLEVMQLVFN
jgi:hypothetical protein